MNAIIAICHFCPDHGPRTLFCTQAFKYFELNNHQLSDDNILETSDNIIIDQSLSPSSNSRKHLQIKNCLLLEPVQPSLVIPDSRKISQSSPSPELLNNSSIGSSPPNQTSSSNSNNNASAIIKTKLNENKSLNNTCKPCKAFEKDFHHYISYDKTIGLNLFKNEQPKSDDSNSVMNDNDIKNNICYISQSTPNDNEVFALVRKACLRTLHCEVFEDPIYFDDDKNGSVIGYEFNIKDAEGRGFQRSYSLIIIMKDRIYLQHLWSFLSQQISIIASNIKTMAKRKYERDMLLEKDANNRLKSNTNNDTSSSFNTNQRDLIKSPKQTRSLIELTDDPQIFAKLHMWFTWILRMSACKITENWLTGPLSEDLLVKLEREELNEFYCENNANMDKSCDISFEIKDKRRNSNFDFEQNKNPSISSYGQENESNNDLDLIDNLIGQFDYINHHQNINSINNKNHECVDFELSSANKDEKDNHDHNNEYEEYNNYNEFFLNNLQVDSLRQLYKLLGTEYFHLIAYHTIVGNQVIVRGKYERFVSSIIKTLEELVPLGCCKSVYYSNEYFKSYECKLLGLNDKVDLFDYRSEGDFTENGIIYLKNVYSDLNEFILIDLVINPKKIQSNSMKNFNNLQAVNNLNDAITEMNDLNITVKTNVNKITKNLSYQNKIESFLSNQKLDDKSVSSLVRQTREEWLNKTKVFYKFAQSPSVQMKINSEQILKILNLNNDDEMALRHWQAGLSKECKVQIRTS